MTYNILTFKQFRQHQADLNFLKHKLKKQLPDDERISLEKDIESKTKIVKHNLNKLHQGVLGEDGVAMSAGPTNVVGSGAIAGTGGKGGEPGVRLPRKKKNPIITSLLKRKSPKMG